MYRNAAAFGILTLLTAGAGSVLAQPLDGRHQIELRFGVWNQFNDTRTEIGNGVSTTVGSSGALGGLAWGHWLTESVALRVSTTALAASVDTDLSGAGVETDVATVSQVTFGIKYYFPASTYGGKARPYVGVGVGPVIGSQSEVRVGSTIRVSERSEAAVGAEVSGGVDLLVSRRIMLSTGLALSLMTDFDRPVGGSDNYTGVQLLLGVSYLLGG